MHIRKLKAGKIFDGKNFTAGKILLIDENATIIGIADDDNDPSTENFEGILSPGFINCHCHLELSHLKKQIKEHTGLINFISQVMQFRHYEKKEITAAIQNAEKEMYDNGIVAVGDICNTTDTLLQKKSTKILYRNFIETMGFVPDMAEARFNISLQNVYNPIAAENEAASIVPHAPYSVSDKLFELVNCHSKNKIVTIHNQETEEENKLFETGKSLFQDFYKLINTQIDFFRPSAKSSLQTWLPKLNLPEQILLVHNTQATEEDILFAEETAAANNQQLYWILCPNANLYIENRLPQINLLIKHHCRIALGTDSLASNHQLSILAEMQTLQRYFPDIPKETLLQWATLNGAEALGFSNLTGRFEKGNTPGVLLLKEDLSEVTRIA